MASFIIETTPIYRTFTVEQSSAIHNIEIEGNYVEIIYQTNPEKAYLHRATSRFVAHLTAILRSPDLLGLSLGSTIAKAKNNGDLEYIEFTED
jgi:hypothetical protein